MAKALRQKEKLRKNPESIHEGNLLMKLCLWSLKKKHEFATGIGFTYQYFNKLVKLEELPMNVKIAASRYCNVPIEYFEGTIALDKKQPVVNEPTVEYVTRMKQMEKELNECNKRIIEKDAHIIELQKKLIQRFESDEA